MSRIQKQVIKHFKKSVQPFTVDKGLYKLGFSLIRRNMLGGATLRQNNFIRHSCIRRLKIFRYRKRLALRRTYLNLVRFAANNVRFNPRSFSANFFSLFDATPVLYAAELKKSFVTLNVFIAYLARQVNLTGVDLNILVSKISRLFPGIPAFFLKYFLWFYVDKISQTSNLVNTIAYNYTLSHKLSSLASVNYLTSLKRCVASTKFDDTLSNKVTDPYTVEQPRHQLGTTLIKLTPINYQFQEAIGLSF